MSEDIVDEDDILYEDEVVQTEETEAASAGELGAPVVFSPDRRVSGLGPTGRFYTLTPGTSVKMSPEDAAFFSESGYGTSE